MRYLLVIGLVLFSFPWAWGMDIDATFIDRLPNYAFDAPKNKPADGDAVTFVAHVKLYDSSTLNTNYIWYLDGIELGSGSLTLLQGVDNTVSVGWIWDSARHEIMIAFDPGNAVIEESEENNIVFDFTDALIMGIAVEESLVEAFPQFQKPLNIGSMSFEDWVQRQARIWNLVLMRQAGELVSSDTIDVQDRVRAMISYHPDGTLAGGNCPLIWKEVDMLWGKLASDIPWYQANKWAWLYEGSLPHELSHARYLPDTYTYDLGATAVEIIDNGGLPVVDTDYLPRFSWDVVYYNKNQGMMSGDYSGRYALFSAYLLNRAAGQRALGCNTNGCCGHNSNWFQSDLPAQSFIKVLHLDGSPWVNARLDIYKRVGVYGEVHVDNIIDHTLYTDSQGRASFPYEILNASPGYSECILKITSPDGSLREYRIVEQTDFHLAYWSGLASSFDYTVKTNFDPVPVATNVTNIWNHDRGETFDMIFTGTNFMPEAAIKFDKSGVIVNTLNVNSPNKITVNLTLPDDLTSDITYRLYNPDGKFVRIKDPYQSGIHMDFHDAKPYARFVHYDIQDRRPGAFYFNGLWSDDWSRLYTTWDRFPVSGTGPIAYWNWDFGDGTTGSLPFMVHAYCYPGVYDVTLTVTDTQGKTDSLTKIVTVTSGYCQIDPALVAAFGPQGLWMYRNAAWTALAGAATDHMASYGNKLAGNFSGYGLWQYDGTSWTQLTSNSSVENLVGVTDKLYADYGGLGLWKYDGGWTQLSSANPDKMTANGDKLLATFSGFGLYQYDGTTWTQLSSNSNVENMLGISGKVYADYGLLGLWKYDGTWTQLSSANPDKMTANGDKLLATFSGFGLYQYDGTTWTELTSNDSVQDLIGVSGNLYADYGTLGLWKYNGTWTQLTAADPNRLGTYGKKLVGNFPCCGLYEYDGSSWTLLTPNSGVTDMVGVDLP